MNKTDFKDMWVFIERNGDSVLPVSLELCSETRKLCDASGEKLAAVIIGDISGGELKKVLDCGVDSCICLHLSFHCRCDLPCMADGLGQSNAGHSVHILHNCLCHHYTQVL